MNEHAQALGRLGGLANKGKPKSEDHKAALRKILSQARVAPKVPEVEPAKSRRCQSSHCPNQGNPILIHGLKAYLCPLHTPKQ